jgi:DNA polymerase III subunit delta
MIADKKGTVSYFTLRNEIVNHKFHPIYILEGEENYYINQLSDLIVSNALTEDEKDFNLTVCYGHDVDIHEFISICKRYPAMSQYQVVVLREAQNVGKGLGDNQSLNMLRYYAQNPQMTTILVVCNMNGNIKAPDFVSEVKKKGNGIIFESKKVTGRDLDGTIISYCKSIGCDIDEKSVSMLADNIGDDLSRMFGEIDKLFILLGDEKKITPSLIEENIGISKDYNNFELENAIRVRDAIKSFKIIDYFEKNPKSNPVVVTIGVLFSYFSNLLLTRTAKDKSSKGIMDQLGTKSSYRANIFINNARYYSTSACVNIIKYLRECDTKMKGINSRQNEFELLRELVFKILHA